MLPGKRHEDVKQLGALSRPESVEARPQSALEFIGTHAWRLARGTQQGTDCLQPEAGHEKAYPDRRFPRLVQAVPNGWQL
jgi:hypothetical protein